MDLTTLHAFTDELAKIAASDVARAANRAAFKGRPTIPELQDWKSKTKDNYAATRYSQDGGTMDVMTSAPGREALP